MKKRYSTFLLLLCAVSWSAAQNTLNLEQTLREVERNNRQLKADREQAVAQKHNLKSENNLPDPTFSLARLWSEKESSGTVSELVLSQQFDFPTLYAQRGKLHGLQGGVYDAQTALARRTLLLAAKECCLDITSLMRKKSLLSQRLAHASGLRTLYEQKLQAGEATQIDVNKIRLEQVAAQAELQLTETALRGRQADLRMMNGGEDIVFDGAGYDPHALPQNSDSLLLELLALDPSVLLAQKESEAAGRQLKINRQQWLPKMELGYRRNTENGAHFSGVVIGCAIPLFGNRHKVSQGKAQVLSSGFRLDETRQRAKEEMLQALREAESLKKTLAEYRSLLQAEESVSLLGKALEGGEINMIEYLTETTLIYQSLLGCMDVENQYQHALARLFRNKL